VAKVVAKLTKVKVMVMVKVVSAAGGLGLLGGPSKKSAAMDKPNHEMHAQLHQRTSPCQKRRHL